MSCNSCGKDTVTQAKYLRDIDDQLVKIELCYDCKRRFFSPEGFIQFGYTAQKIIDICISN